MSHVGVYTSLCSMLYMGIRDKGDVVAVAEDLCMSKHALSLCVVVGQL